MSEYRGMRWFRCDLQVQTPEDGRHWDSDDPLRLGSPGQRDEQDLQEKARRYLRRCHEAGLDVIGVTDHNFCSHRDARQRFLAHLIEQNQAVAEDLGGPPLWIFPGFEVDIGFHVLCLFPPRKSKGLDEVCDILSQLGLPPAKRFGGNGPADLRQGSSYVPLSDLLKVVQEEHGGLVIAAHAFEEDGIAEGSGRWAEDCRNEELLAVEVTGFPLNERERSILEASGGKWGRSRSPAYIQSSDAKSTLVDAQGEPKPNSLGYRWTWIKMSEPSIEALRQAFLDPQSRVRQRQQNDPRIVRHSRIESVGVQGVAFLADQEAHLSPHLNCIIGGRGSGKSSLFEYIRFAVRREDEPAAAEQVSRIRTTLGESAEVTLKWRPPDEGSGRRVLEDEFRFTPPAAKAQVVSRDVVDPATVFRSLDLQILSQGQITSIWKDPGYLLALIDELARQEIHPLEKREVELRERLSLLQQERRSWERVEAEQRSLEQEAADLERQWQARSALQSDQRMYRGAQEARRYLSSLRSRSEEIVRGAVQWADDLAESHAPLGSAVESWPQAAVFEQLDAQVESAQRELAESIRQAAERYRARIQELTTGAPEWPSMEGEIRRTEEEFLAACANEGLRPEDLDQVRHLDSLRAAKSFEADAKRRQAAEIRSRVQLYSELLQELHAVWREQTEARRRGVEAILQSGVIPQVPVRAAGREAGYRPSLEVDVAYSADKERFRREWQGQALRPPQGMKTRLGKSWEEIGDEVFEEFLASQRGSPWEVVERWMEGGGVPLPKTAGELYPSLKEHLERIRELWEGKTLLRIPDAVDLVLYRPDGTRAGSIAQKELSDGQRNTAILTLLLAKGDGPILIDQPEDELDSNFISEQLVPLLRKVKEERQVILVTHNPNFPVNADAELVYALQAESGDGKRAHGTVLAQGGLDRDEVKRAVLDIMEGSKDAFLRRREKYHF